MCRVGSPTVTEAEQPKARYSLALEGNPMSWTEAVFHTERPNTLSALTLSAMLAFLKQRERAMERQVIKSQYPQPDVKWWPFRPRYLRLMSAYRSYTTGRCSPSALVRRPDGTFTKTDVLAPPENVDDTWLVQPYWSGGPERVPTKDIVDIQCSRVVAGYEC